MKGRLRNMTESNEHRVLKQVFARILEGHTECPTGSKRVDACNQAFTAEVECGPKQGEERVCRVDIRRQPDLKNASRQDPLLSFHFTSSQIQEFEPLLKANNIPVKRSSA